MQPEVRGKREVAESPVRGVGGSLVWFVGIQLFALLLSGTDLPFRLAGSAVLVLGAFPLTLWWHWHIWQPKEHASLRVITALFSGFAGGILLGGAAFVTKLLPAMDRRALQGVETALNGATIGIAACFVCLLSSPITARVARRYRQFIDSSECSHCGYDLTGNVSGMCPECGTPAAKPRGGVAPTPRVERSETRRFD